MNIIIILILLFIIVYIIYNKKQIISESFNNLEYNNYNYKLIGKAVNKIYNQIYYLYESKKDQNGNLSIRNNLDYLDEQIYSYLFVSIDNNKTIINYELGPRSKINKGDVVFVDRKYLSIGPYIII